MSERYQIVCKMVEILNWLNRRETFLFFFFLRELYFSLITLYGLK